MSEAARSRNGVRIVARTAVACQIAVPIRPGWRAFSARQADFPHFSRRRLAGTLRGMKKGEVRRCSWCLGSELYVEYHDREWGVPVHDDRVHFEFLLLEGAQAGLSWSTILNKREAYRKAFASFDPAKVARFGPARIETLLADPGIVRNRLKVESAVNNARRFLAVQKEYSTFDAYVWRFVNG